MDPDTAAPTTRLRSGGPESLVSWESLGHQGRLFVHGATTVDELSVFNGARATEPIRAYAGLNSADTIRETAQLAARELQHRRVGPFRRRRRHHDRYRLDQQGRSRRAGVHVQRRHRDVSMQYSFLPSWISFLVDKENARQAGQALFEAVDELVREMPEAQRPKLVVFGESLGSFGGEARS